MRFNHGMVTRVDFTNGDSYEKKITLEKFVNECKMMERCASCGFHKGNNFSDLVVGDFWAFNKFKNVVDNRFDVRKGTNIVTINTKKGKDVFDKI